ncbi:MAG: hypothetical protein QXF88_00120 [Candidatus Aenigmatarchaeota archaeon]
MKKAYLFGLIMVFLLIVFLTAKKETYYLKPQNATDSDGTDAADIINNIENGYEMVSLKANPYGYVEVSNFKPNSIVTNAYAEFDWKAYKDTGVSNIYIGYSFGNQYKEIGPFDYSTMQTIKIPVNIFTDFSKLKLRIRGEDSDFGADAIAEVSIKLQVTELKIL